ncbi:MULTISPECIES: hypothetical protein [Streptomyces]|uniref:hypothetical protein n=1 Tax=Streptomyces TaxID=1883 RepID=UPI0004BD877F|nr:MULTISPECIES: hypothetical protein [Streptomyces]KOU11432.1 hypothetical protein ADK87_01175 [Streptomyces sp. NRRL F-4711]KOX34530.1 hypothetical protein ADL07_07325 [Streptomyces sp. NRRL F-4707]MCL7366119.1 hypothetical protein [Streptomyces ardesiacus]
MGVFARLFRRSKSTEEASAGETRTGTPDTGGAAEAGTAEAPEPGDAGPRDTAEAGEATGPVAEGGDSESVGIPKQQSAGEAVDNEADKGART